jgi:hypothetical protein
VRPINAPYKTPLRCTVIPGGSSETVLRVTMREGLAPLTALAVDDRGLSARKIR